MPSGMQVFNSQGTIVADVTSPTYMFRNKYTITVPAGAGRVRAAIIDVANCENPVFVARCTLTNRRFTIDWRPKPGVPGTYEVRALALHEVFDEEDMALQYETVNTAALPVEVFHFDWPIMSAEKSGLQLFDGTGRCTFDSNLRPARVARALLSSFGSDDWTAPSGVRVGVLPFYNYMLSFRNTAPNGYYELWWREAFVFLGERVLTRELFCHNAITGVSPGTLYEKPHGTPGVLFIDLAGLP